MNLFDLLVPAEKPVCQDCKKVLNEHEVKSKETAGLCFSCFTDTNLLTRYRKMDPSLVVCRGRIYTIVTIANPSKPKNFPKGFSGKKFDIEVDIMYAASSMKTYRNAGGNVKPKGESAVIVIRTDDLFYNGSVKEKYAQEMTDTCTISPDPFAPIRRLEINDGEYEY